MEEIPSRDPSEERQPFDSEALEPVQFSGCGRPALIGCGLSLLFLAAVFLFLLFKAGDLAEWALGVFEGQVLSGLPPDVTQAERERLIAAFDGAIWAIESGQANAEALPALQSALLATSRKIEALSRDDVLELIAALEAVAAAAPAVGADPRGPVARVGAGGALPA